jgi:hypothetical protein
MISARYNYIVHSLLVENYNLRCKYAECHEKMEAMEANEKLLMDFIQTNYDMSGEYVKSYDGSGNMLSCMHMDASGDFIPCVLPPTDDKNEDDYQWQPVIIEPMSFFTTQQYDCSMGEYDCSMASSHMK